MNTMIRPVAGQGKKQIEMGICQIQGGICYGNKGLCALSQGKCQCGEDLIRKSLICAQKGNSNVVAGAKQVPRQCNTCSLQLINCGACQVKSSIPGLVSGLDDIQCCNVCCGAKKVKKALAGIEKGLCDIKRGYCNLR